MFLDDKVLIERLAASVGGSRPVVFLIGSGATMPRRGGRGVPSSREIIKLIRTHLRPGTLKDDASYQEAFETLIQRRGQDFANLVIRDAVFGACRAQADSLDDRSLSKLEADWDLWEIPEGLAALAALAAHHPASFGRTVLTTNFDPLLEVAFARAGVSWHSTALHSDGSLLYLRGSGIGIVHLHGYWWGSDTLHTTRQVTVARPQLAASLRRLLADSLLVVIGYGGWEDVFTTELCDAVAGNDVSIDLLWAFHAGDDFEILRVSSPLIERLGPALRRGRAHFFKGIETDALWSSLFKALCAERPAETVRLYLDRVLFTLSQRRAYSGLTEPWSDPHASFGDFVKPLKAFSQDLPARAAVHCVELMLPYLEAQPIHQAPSPKRHFWVREALNRALGVLGTTEPPANDRNFLMGSAADALQDSHKLDDASQESVVLRGAAYALAAVMASIEGSCDLEGYYYPTDYWAARAVHLIARSSYDQAGQLALHLKSRLGPSATA